MPSKKVTPQWCSYICSKGNYIAYYKVKGSTVQVCILDASKAFYRVNQAIIVRIIDDCYNKQVLCMKWNGTISETFSATNGVKQDGILSPTLFCIYIDILLEKLKEHPAGCRTSGRCTGTIAYADDIAL